MFKIKKNKTKQNKNETLVNQHKTDSGLIKLNMYMTPNLCSGYRFIFRIKIDYKKDLRDFGQSLSM